MKEFPSTCLRQGLRTGKGSVSRPLEVTLDLPPVCSSGLRGSAPSKGENRTDSAPQTVTPKGKSRTPRSSRAPKSDRGPRRRRSQAPVEDKRVSEESTAPPEPVVKEVEVAQELPPPEYSTPTSANVAARAANEVREAEARDAPEERLGIYANQFDPVGGYPVDEPFYDRMGNIYRLDSVGELDIFPRVNNDYSTLEFTNLSFRGELEKGVPKLEEVITLYSKSSVSDRMERNSCLSSNSSGSLNTSRNRDLNADDYSKLNGSNRDQRAANGDGFQSTPDATKGKREAYECLLNPSNIQYSCKASVKPAVNHDLDSTGSSSSSEGAAGPNGDASTREVGATASSPADTKGDNKHVEKGANGSNGSDGAKRAEEGGAEKVEEKNDEIDYVKYLNYVYNQQKSISYTDKGDAVRVKRGRSQLGKSEDDPSVELPPDPKLEADRPRSKRGRKRASGYRSRKGQGGLGESVSTGSEVDLVAETARGPEPPLDPENMVGNGGFQKDENLLDFLCSNLNVYSKKEFANDFNSKYFVQNYCIQYNPVTFMNYVRNKPLGPSDALDLSLDDSGGTGPNGGRSPGDDRHGGERVYVLNNNDIYNLLVKYMNNLKKYDGDPFSRTGNGMDGYVERGGSLVLSDSNRSGSGDAYQVKRSLKDVTARELELSRGRAGIKLNESSNSAMSDNFKDLVVTNEDVLLLKQPPSRGDFADTFRASELRRVENFKNVPEEADAAGTSGASQTDNLNLRDIVIFNKHISNLNSSNSSIAVEDLSASHNSVTSLRNNDRNSSEVTVNPNPEPPVNRVVTRSQDKTLPKPAETSEPVSGPGRGRRKRRAPSPSNNPVNDRGNKKDPPKEPVNERTESDEAPQPREKVRRMDIDPLDHLVDSGCSEKRLSEQLEEEKGLLDKEDLIHFIKEMDDTTNTTSSVESNYYSNTLLLSSDRAESKDPKQQGEGQDLYKDVLLGDFNNFYYNDKEGSVPVLRDFKQLSEELNARPSSALGNSEELNVADLNDIPPGALPTSFSQLGDSLQDPVIETLMDPQQKLLEAARTKDQKKVNNTLYKRKYNNNIANATNEFKLRRKQKYHFNIIRSPFRPNAIGSVSWSQPSTATGQGNNQLNRSASNTFNGSLNPSSKRDEDDELINLSTPKNKKVSSVNLKCLELIRSNSDKLVRTINYSLIKRKNHMSSSVTKDNKRNILLNPTNRTQDHRDNTVPDEKKRRIYDNWVSEMWNDNINVITCKKMKLGYGSFSTVSLAILRIIQPYAKASEGPTSTPERAPRNEKGGEEGEGQKNLDRKRVLFECAIKNISDNYGEVSRYQYIREKEMMLHFNQNVLKPISYRIVYGPSNNKVYQLLLPRAKGDLLTMLNKLIIYRTTQVIALMAAMSSSGSALKESSSKDESVNTPRNTNVAQANRMLSASSLSNRGMRSFRTLSATREVRRPEGESGRKEPDEKKENADNEKNEKNEDKEKKERRRLYGLFAVEIKYLLTQIINGLSFVHMCFQGNILRHTDIKLANVLVFCEDEDKFVPLKWHLNLADFGCSALIRPNQYFNQINQLYSTLNFGSPMYHGHAGAGKDAKDVYKDREETGWDRYVREWYEQLHYQLLSYNIGTLRYNSPESLLYDQYLNKRANNNSQLLNLLYQDVPNSLGSDSPLSRPVNRDPTSSTGRDPGTAESNSQPADSNAQLVQSNSQSVESNAQPEKVPEPVLPTEKYLLAAGEPARRHRGVENEATLDGIKYIRVDNKSDMWSLGIILSELIKFSINDTEELLSRVRNGDLNIFAKYLESMESSGVDSAQGEKGSRALKGNGLRLSAGKPIVIKDGLLRASTKEIKSRLYSNLGNGIFYNRLHNHMNGKRRGMKHYLHVNPKDNREYGKDKEEVDRENRLLSVCINEVCNNSFEVRRSKLLELYRKNDVEAVSGPLLDLLANLLAYRPEERMLSVEVLGHPCFQDASDVFSLVDRSSRSFLAKLSRLYSLHPITPLTTTAVGSGGASASTGGNKVVAPGRGVPDKQSEDQDDGGISWYKGPLYCHLHLNRGPEDSMDASTVEMDQDDPSMDKKRNCVYRLDSIDNFYNFLEIQSPTHDFTQFYPPSPNSNRDPFTLNREGLDLKNDGLELKSGGLNGTTVGANADEEFPKTVECAPEPSASGLDSPRLTSTDNREGGTEIQLEHKEVKTAEGEGQSLPQVETVVEPSVPLESATDQVVEDGAGVDGDTEAPLSQERCEIARVSGSRLDVYKLEYNILLKRQEELYGDGALLFRLLDQIRRRHRLDYQQLTSTHTSHLLARELLELRNRT